MKNANIAGACLLVTLALASASNALAASYRLVNLGGGAFDPYSATDVNNLGQVVGFHGDAYPFDFTNWVPGGKGAVAWDAQGIRRELFAAGQFTNSAAYGINDSGQITGFYYDQGNAALRGYVLDNTSGLNTLSAPSGSSSYAFKINNNGQVVGTVGGYAAKWDSTNSSANTYQSTFTRPDKTEGFGINNQGTLVGNSNGAPSITGINPATGISGMVALGTLPNLGSGGAAIAINDRDIAVGYSGYRRATLWNRGITNGFGGGFLLDMGTLGGSESAARDINNQNQVVGFADNVNNIDTAFIWTESGGMVDLNSLIDAPGWHLTQANAINDNGWIVGIGHNANDSGNGIWSSAFLLIPVPEPESYAMMLAGLGLLVFVARRRKL